VKDLVDILLIAELGKMNGQVLRQSLVTTFAGRRTHELPEHLPDPPPTWRTPFRRLAGETGLDCETLQDAANAAHRFLDPVLRTEETGTWDPMSWSWRLDRCYQSV
jgi:hypothetical protein